MTISTTIFPASKSDAHIMCNYIIYILSSGHLYSEQEPVEGGGDKWSLKLMFGDDTFPTPPNWGLALVLKVLDQKEN